MLRHAREQDMVISVVFDGDDSPVLPAAGREDEQRYFTAPIAWPSQEESTPCTCNTAAT